MSKTERDEAKTLSEVCYWIREGYFGLALAEIDRYFGDGGSARSTRRVGGAGPVSGTSRGGGGGSDTFEPKLLLLRALSLTKLGRTADAQRLLGPMAGRWPALRVAVLHAQRLALLAEAQPDREGLRELEKELPQAWMEAQSEGAYAAALVLCFESASAERARQFVDKLKSSSNSAVLALRGWIELNSIAEKSSGGKLANDLGQSLNAASELFDKAIQIDKCPEAYLGKAKCYEFKGELAEMRDILNALLNDSSGMLPAYVELARAAGMTREWDTVLEICQRASVLNSECLPVLVWDITLTIFIHGEGQGSAEQLLSELYEAMNRLESTNASLHYRFARLLASTAFDFPLLRIYAGRLLERALQQRSQWGELHVLRARLALLEGDTRNALLSAGRALELGAAGPEAALRLVQAHLDAGNLREAREQLQFLEGTDRAQMEAHPLHPFLTARLQWASLSSQQQQQEIGEAADALFQACKKSFQALMELADGLDFFSLDALDRLDPSLLTQLALTMLELARTGAVPGLQAYQEVERVLGVVHEWCPGLARPTFLLAKVKFLCGDYTPAESLLRDCIDKNNQSADAYVLLAQIYLQRGDVEGAVKLLDAGLGFNFRVREHPVYFLAKAKVEKAAGKHEQALELLRAGLELKSFAQMGQKSTATSSSIGTPRQQQQMGKSFGASGGPGELNEVFETDRIALYLETIDSLQALGKIEEADMKMREAIGRYRGRQELEQRLVLMNTELLLLRGNVDGALQALSRVPHEDTNYTAARTRMARIYLEEKHDKRRFAACYRDILEHAPSTQAWEQLGDAYISIQEPELALDAYETAMRRAPKDFRLAEKIGDAYVKCHLYNKALTFFETAMKHSGRSNALRLRFAEQLLAMGNGDKCRRVLRDVLESNGGAEPSEGQGLREHIQSHCLLGRLNYEAGDWNEAVRSLGEARRLQQRLLAKANREASNTQEERKMAANICRQLAEMHVQHREWARAIECYREAMTHDQQDLKAMLALATIFITTGRLSDCGQMCQQALAVDKNNTDAILILADLMYARNEGSEAIKHFAQILTRSPCHYHALARYIELVWRQGNDELAENALKNALEYNPRATVDAGYNYCKGLLEWYVGDMEAAMQSFNRSRRDLEWGERALYNIIEICLNPENELLGAGAIQHQEMESGADSDTDRSFGVRAAERFFKELRVKSTLDARYRIVETSIALASPNKQNVQRALGAFLEMCRHPDGAPQSTPQQNVDMDVNVRAILGAARGHMILKQTPKAKAQLKRVLQRPWSLEEADALEQCWLLLADIYINQNKSDQATSVLRTVLQHNASCAKAYEYMGFICEKEQNHVDAAFNYESAWKVTKRRNPALGYKLAYNLFKCRRLFDCIEVCQTVLRQYPGYPKIKSEILDKARANLRM